MHVFKCTPNLNENLQNILFWKPKLPLTILVESYFLLNQRIKVPTFMVFSDNAELFKSVFVWISLFQDKRVVEGFQNLSFLHNDFSFFAGFRVHIYSFYNSQSLAFFILNQNQFAIQTCFQCFYFCEVFLLVADAMPWLLFLSILALSFP